MDAMANDEVRVRRTDAYKDGAFTWEICKPRHARPFLHADYGFLTEVDARTAGAEALSRLQCGV
jgi:hypothetical protein